VEKLETNWTFVEVTKTLISVDGKTDRTTKFITVVYVSISLSGSTCITQKFQCDRRTVQQYKHTNTHSYTNDWNDQCWL